MPWKHGWDKRGPPWAQGHGPSEGGHRHRPRGLLFLRFTVMFGLMVLLLFGGMAAVAFVVTRLVGGGGQTAVLVWVLGLSLALALPVLAVATAMRAFRRIATPLADIMAAADAVARGDLNARVSEGGRGAFDRLTTSFNRMVDELRRTDQLRRNLTADVAHELRTPLHVIQGNLEGIQDNIYEATSEHIAATLEETRLLGRLVDDLNTLALAESGQLPLVKEELDVGDLLVDVAAAFASQTDSAGIALESDVANDGAVTVIADAGRLQQVMGNLVSNALRHTESGGTISIRASSTSKTVLLEVSDTGEGIPAEDLPFVFDRFWRGEPSRARAGHMGGGLGLAIARQLVEAHGGQIDVRSEPGEGTDLHDRFASRRNRDGLEWQPKPHRARPDTWVSTWVGPRSRLELSPRQGKYCHGTRSRATPAGLASKYWLTSTPLFSRSRRSRLQASESGSRPSGTMIEACSIANCPGTRRWMDSRCAST